MRDYDREEKRLEAIVNDEQYSLAIGTHGQNVRLASKLVGWTIDVKREADKKDEIMAQMGGGDDPVDGAPVSDLPGVGEKTADKLVESGFATVESIAEAGVEDVAAVPGFGEKSAARLIEKAREFLQGEDS